MKNTTTPILIVTLLLAGCGGGGGEMTEDMPCEAGAFCDVSAKFAETLSDVGLANVDEIEGSSAAQRTSADDLPKGGDVSYSGNILLSAPQLAGSGEGAEGGIIIGSVDIEVDFEPGARNFEGSATGFVSEGSGAYDGTLNFDNGNVYSGDAYLTALDAAVGDQIQVVAPDPNTPEPDVTGLISDLTGTLTSAANVETSFDGTSFSTFNDTDANVLGLAIGTTETDDEEGTFSGFVVADQ